MNPLFPCFRFVSVGCAFVILSVLALPVRLIAQDVTICAPVTYTAIEDDEDVPLKLKKSPKPAYPAALRKSDTYGYTIMFSPAEADTEAIRKKIPPAYLLKSTDNAFRIEMRRVAQNWKWDPEYQNEDDGRRAWVVIIFNPANASASKKDASPRLLDVRPVILPHDARMGANDLVAWSLLTISPSGEIKSFEITSNSPVAEKYENEIKDCLSTWKIAPARAKGVPIEATIQVPLLLMARLPMPPSEASRTTKLIPAKFVDTVYPENLEGLNVRGTAIVEFTLDEKGRPQAPAVLISDNENFDAPAIDAILKYRFELPPRGKPDSRGKAYASLQDARWQYELRFAPPIVSAVRGPAIDIMPSQAILTPSGNLITMPNQAIIRARTELRSKANPVASGRNVTSPVLEAESVKTVTPVYPYALLTKGVTGSATVRIQTLPSGTITRVQIIESSHEDFGNALLAAARHFTLTPARYKGSPTSTIATISFDFHPENPDLKFSPEAQAMLNADGNHANDIATDDKLDAPLKIKKSAALQSFRHALLPPGRATIEFLVDKTGRVQLPRIVQTLAPEAAFAAMQEISMRVYEPPMQQGKPVTVRTQLTLVYEPSQPRR